MTTTTLVGTRMVCVPTMITMLAVAHVGVLAQVSISELDDTAQLNQAMEVDYDPIDLSAFRDSIHHWQMNIPPGNHRYPGTPSESVKQDAWMDHVRLPEADRSLTTAISGHEEFLTIDVESGSAGGSMP